VLTVRAMEAPLCHQELGAILARVQQPTPTSVNCSFVHYTQQGGLQWINQGIPACADVSSRSTGVAHTALCDKNLAFYWVSGSGQFVWQFGMRGGQYAQMATLPNRYNFTIGIAKLNDSFALVTTDAVYTLPDKSPAGAPLVQQGFLSFFRISKNAVIAYSGNVIYIADGATLFTYQNGEVLSNSQVKPLTQIADMQFIVPLSKLLLTSQDKVYLLDPTVATNAPKLVTTLPASSGAARVNTVDRDMWLFVDNGKLFNLNLKSGNVNKGVTIDIVGLLGYIQYFN